MNRLLTSTKGLNKEYGIMQDVFKKKASKAVNQKTSKKTNGSGIFKSLTFAGLSLISLCSQAFSAPLPNELPTAYQAASGNVSFQQNGNTLNVNSSSNSAIVNYGTFSVGSNGVVNMNLPSSTSTILNRVTGSQASEIFGQINSNGKVFLVNPNGVLFGSSAQVNVGSLFASSLGISDSDFLSGNYTFSGGSNKGVVNLGQITSGKGGFVGLFGGAVQNGGAITSPSGQIQLAVGDTIKVQVAQGIEVDVQVTDALKQSISNFQNGISNTGTLNAEGGTVKLQASLQDAFYNSVISNKGVITANSLVNLSDGSIELIGKTNNAKALVQNDGQLLSSGGNIQVVGDKVVFTGGSSLTGMQSRDGAIFSSSSIDIGSAVNVTNLSLRAGTGINQSAPITSNRTSILAKDSVNLSNAANNFSLIAANLTGKGSSLKLADSGNIQVDEVDGMNGIFTNDGNVVIDAAKTITLWRDVNVGAGTVNLNAGNNIQQNAGTITADTLNMTTKTGSGTGFIDGAIFTDINNLSVNSPSPTSTFKVLNKADKNLNLLDSSAGSLIRVETQGSGKINVLGTVKAGNQELWTASTVKPQSNPNSVPINAVSFTDGDFLKALEAEITAQLNAGTTSGSVKGASTNINDATLRQIIDEFKNNAKVRTWEEYKQAMESKGYKVDVEFTHQFESTLSDGRTANVTVNGSAKEMYENFRTQSLNAEKQALASKLQKQTDQINWTQTINKTETQRRDQWSDASEAGKQKLNLDTATKRGVGIGKRNDNEIKNAQAQIQAELDRQNWWNSLTPQQQADYNAQQAAKATQEELDRQAEAAAKKQKDLENYMNQYNLDWQAQFSEKPTPAPVETPAPTPTDIPNTPVIIEQPTPAPLPSQQPSTPVVIEQPAPTDNPVFVPVVVEKPLGSPVSFAPVSAPIVTITPPVNAPVSLPAAPSAVVVSAPTYYADVPGLSDLLPASLNSIDTVQHAAPATPAFSAPEQLAPAPKPEVAKPAYYYYPGLW